MSKIKLYLEELAELVMVKARDNDIHNDYEHAQTLQIITSALVELGESTSVEQEIDKKFITLQTVQWDGSISTKIKFKEQALSAYGKSQQNGELELLELTIGNLMYYVKMTEEELESLVYAT